MATSTTHAVNMATKRRSSGFRKRSGGFAVKASPTANPFFLINSIRRYMGIDACVSHARGRTGANHHNGALFRGHGFIEALTVCPKLSTGDPRGDGSPLHAKRARVPLPPRSLALVAQFHQLADHSTTRSRCPPWGPAQPARAPEARPRDDQPRPTNPARPPEAFSPRRASALAPAHFPRHTSAIG